jgi:hypothetical protein
VAPLSLRQSIPQKERFGKPFVQILRFPSGIACFLGMIRVSWAFGAAIAMHTASIPAYDGIRLGEGGFFYA